MKHTLWIVLATLAAGLASAQVTDLDQPAAAPNAKPDIWAKAAEADAKKAEEAARQDACVRLVEAAYRLPVASNRDVLDMLIKNAQVDKDLVKALAAAKPIDAQYLEDGTVRITVTTTPAEVSAILKKAYANVDWDKAEEDSTIAAVATQTKKDMVITAVGEGALAGSAGEKRIPVRRAALEKAEADIAGQVLAMVLRDDYRTQDHVADFCTAIPQAKKKLALGLGLTRIVQEDWAADGSLDLRAEVNAKPVVGLLVLAQNLYDGRGKFNNWGWSAMRTAAEDMILIGSGKAKATETTVPPAPLALETKAVDEAMKAVKK